MLLGLDEPDRSQLAHGHLAHASEEQQAARIRTMPFLNATVLLLVFK